MIYKAIYAKFKLKLQEYQYQLNDQTESTYIQDEVSDKIFESSDFNFKSNHCEIKTTSQLGNFDASSDSKIDKLTE